MTPNLAAFLRVIRAGESSQDDSAYTTMFGGGQFNGFQDHPRHANTVAGLTSTAAGAYQFLSKTWDECAAALRLPDFSPQSQDLAAVFLIKRRGALDDVEAGRIPQAIQKCAKEWASLPGSPYGQPTRTLTQALATYAQYGGALAAVDTQPFPFPSPTQEKPMLPGLIAALLPTIIESIPKLGKLFGTGTKVSDRNLAAAGVVLDAIKGATGATTEQQAVEKLKSDPVALQAAQQAVQDKWLELSEMIEAGGGGIAGARAVDPASRGDLLHSASFWVSLLFMPLLYMIVGSLIGIIGGVTWSDSVRAGLIGSIVSAILGGMVGYYFGQTTSRNRTPPA